ncbi:BTAD domain-containing putative transcriptional regulator [Kitasatospora sp. CM 4170]|uniref:BTAD domain-containing putative transcriptional regulator n=1 Tax=Kitasatospora aburaviensis TaxID=67265 RepID=A0ABW1F9D5_9ACTN|nr:BTAD domain-containing putative transcriptional regulator [Kitasatospora sp. CM 4170]WNM49150.1 BTAD domain-containing putative transcriptional regulator [Kitasatospora sp. CM 4170]
MAGLRICVLGPVRVRCGGRDVPAGSGQRQAVLAALALRAGHVVTADALAGLVWGESAPASVGAVVRNHISKLRAAVGAAGGDAAAVLVSRGGGYALDLADGGLDAAEFDRLADAARRHRERDEPAEAVLRYREALALWTGTALSGVPGPDADRQRERLAERRLTVLDDCLELELGLGEHARLVEELTALAAEHPLREGLRGLLMTALYRAGRQAEALEVFADARRVLAAEVGVEPGPELRGLQRRILRADPGLAPRAPARPSASASAVPSAPVAAPAVPAQLPPDVGDFTGRAAEVELIANALAGDAGRPGAAGAVVLADAAVVTVSGAVGVGKTTLAVRVARTVRGAFVDGQLYADLNGTRDEPAEPGSVLAGFLRALGEPAEGMPDGTAERAQRYRTLLAGRRVLVVLDGARDEEQLRHLLPGGSAAAVLVTARSGLTGLAPSLAVRLGRLTPGESVEFLSAVAGRSRIAAEPAAADAIAAACGRLPLALRVAATKLAARPAWSVAAFADRLRDEHRRLGELRVGGLAVETELRRSHRLLPADLAAALPRLAALPVCSAPEAAAALGVPEPAAGVLLERLTAAGMVDAPVRGRYAFHDLVRLFALQPREPDPSQRV